VAERGLCQLDEPAIHRTFIFDWSIRNLT